MKPQETTCTKAMVPTDDTYWSSLLEHHHEILDAPGMVPVIDEITDDANAVLLNRCQRSLPYKLAD